jgi:hypothetical protein
MLCLLVNVAGWILGGHHLSSAGAEVNSFFRVCGNMLFQVGVLWLLYVALEPYGRRFWPDGLLGWTRLFAGHVRDPRIGRELLLGVALGGVLIVTDLLRALAPYLVGRPPGLPVLDGDVRTLGGPGSLALIWSAQFYSSIQTALLITMTFVALRLLVRRTWIAVAIGMVAVTIAVAGSVPFGDVLWMFLLFQLITIAILTFAIFRYGLLVTAVMLLVDNIVTVTPILTHGPAWASLPGNLSIGAALGLAAFGYYAARGSQPLFGHFDA